VEAGSCVNGSSEVSRTWVEWVQRVVETVGQENREFCVVTDTQKEQTVIIFGVASVLIMTRGYKHSE
jgi:hypothetical protein